jgi:hypothetical protein
MPIQHQTISRPRPTGHVNCPAETAARVRTFVARWGLKIAARAWGLDDHTVTRAAAGFNLQACVLGVVEEGLEMSDTELEAFVRAAQDRRLSAGR